MVDADYKFINVDVGSEGSTNDASIFNNSSLHTALQNNTVNFLPHHVILGDGIFQLKTWLMKPYGRRRSTAKEVVFSYRLFRARRVVENAFGILTRRFRIFSRPIELKLDTVDALVLHVLSTTGFEHILQIT